MKIKSFKIDKLFGMFDYDISFENEDNILILTGPNGYGKTMILNLLYEILSNKLLGESFKKPFFNEFSIDTQTHKINGKKNIGGCEVKIEKKNDKSISDSILDNIGINEDKTSEFGELVKVYFIKEQRIIKEEKIKDSENKSHTVIKKTITNFSTDLKKRIERVIQLSFDKTQQLDSSYLDRLIDEKDIISEVDYISRMTAINKKQEKLIEFGIYENSQKIRSYSPDDAKALLVYVQDLEEKLKVFDNLLLHLEIFTSILNDRRLLFKKIRISKQNGFSIAPDIPLTGLSSGEQNEIIMLYELLFNVEKGSLVLIDEPEISLHVAWQKEYLNDLIKIVKLKDLQAIIATHSPTIINGRWDLVYTLKSPNEE